MDSPLDHSRISFRVIVHITPNGRFMICNYSKNFIDSFDHVIVAAVQYGEPA